MLKGERDEGNARQVKTIVLDKGVSLKDQMEAVSQTDILVGAHGAGLFWLLLLPSCGTVLEFGTGADMHYVHLSVYAGINHAFLGSGTGHSVGKFRVEISTATQEKLQSAIRFVRSCRSINVDD